MLLPSFIFEVIIQEAFRRQTIPTCPTYLLHVGAKIVSVTAVCITKRTSLRSTPIPNALVAIIMLTNPAFQAFRLNILILVINAGMKNSTIDTEVT